MVIMLPQRSKREEATTSSSSASFSYMPLHPKLDSIRLLKILAWDTSDVSVTALKKNCPADMIKCSLAVFPFSNKPKYHALSYSWGDVTTKRAIEVNGSVFCVGENLWDALNDVEIGGNETLIWIDAICINQADTQERSRQVRLMPYIYSRAQVVHVWLGKSGFESTDEFEQKMSAALQSMSGAKYHDEQLDQTRLSCKRAYWERVWIVQEIGKARSILVHDGIRVIDWDTYIRKIRSQVQLSDSVIAVQLSNEKDARYTTGHSFENLLRNHEHALCKEPRDKIYGFIGLASDCAGTFPIDYNKTLWEVYEDTVRFKIKDVKRRHYDMLNFFRLVTRMMGGPQVIYPPRSPLDFHCLDTTSSKTWPELQKDDVICLPTRLVGRVEHLGPGHQAVIAELHTVDEWRRSIPTIFAPDMLPRALEVSDLFLEALEDFDEEDEGYCAVLTMERESTWVQSQPSYSLVRFERDHPQKPNLQRQYSSTDDQATGLRSAFMKGDTFKSNGATRATKPSRLFHLQICDDVGEPPLMGLAPSGAEEGDLVVQVQGLERAIVLHLYPRDQDGSQIYKIVGCAGLAEGDLSVARGRRGKHLEDGKQPFFTTGTFDYLTSQDEVAVYMDIPTAWEISQPWEPRRQIEASGVDPADPCLRPRSCQAVMVHHSS